MNIQEIASASAQIKELLTPLAEKIGQTGQYIFGLFLRQVYVNALIDLLWLPVGGFSFWLANHLYRWNKKHKNELGDEVFFLWMVVAGLLIFGLITILVPLGGLIQALVNPQYKAIELIIQTLKATK